MTQRDAEQEALERVTLEMRDAPPPDVDWDRVEQKLFSRIEVEEASTRRSTTFRVFAALAVAAAVLLVLGALSGRKGDTASRAPSPTARQARVFGAPNVDGASLVPGDRVLAEQAAVLVDHPGRARWTLEPSSQASLTQTGAVIGVKLERGSISAEVVPAEAPETFVIETERARVAVHGTKFRVALRDEGVDVSVTEGIVAVGGRGQKPGYLLRAGDSGRFSKDGANGQVERASEASRAPHPSEAKVPGAQKRELPSAPSGAEIEKALDTITSLAVRCFGSDTAEGEVRVQVQTEARVSFGPDGKLRSLAFDPPLFPAVNECVQREAAKLKVGESAKGGDGQRSVLLGK